MPNEYLVHLVVHYGIDSKIELRARSLNEAGLIKDLLKPNPIVTAIVIAHNKGE